LKDSDYAVVIGGANIDIHGIPAETLKMGDSNPGVVNLSAGGVGRNIAENTARLGVDVKLLTAVGKDPHGNQILTETASAGVDTGRVLRLTDQATSTYLAILDESGDLNIAISHMEIMDRVDIAYIKANASLIADAALLIVDTNIPIRSIEYLSANFADRPIFADSVSASKAVRLKTSLAACHTIKPNKFEAEVLTGTKISKPDDAPKAAAKLLAKGVQRVFLSLGEKGLYFCSRDAEELIQIPETKIINATGAGDAFMAGLAYCFLNRISGGEAARFALGASAIAIGHANTINPHISVANINVMARKIKC